MLAINLIKSSDLQKQIFTGITQQLNISKLMKSDCKLPNSMGMNERTCPKHKDGD